MKSGSNKSGNKWGIDLLLCAWFALVGLVFWSPYPVALPLPVMTALYGLFLVLFIATLVLRLLRHGQETHDASAAADMPDQTTERIAHRGE